jgi:transcriptional regulator with XRE-family HTH domain
MELRLKDILRQRKQSISSFAASAGITQANMSNIVNGKNSPSLDTLQKIAEALDIPIYDLFISNDVSGFIKYQGDIKEIRSMKDIEDILGVMKK